MPAFISPSGMAIVGLAIASACIGGCSTYPENQLAVGNGVPCVYDNPQQAMPYNGNVGGSIGGRMILGATPADNKPLCYTR